MSILAMIGIGLLVGIIAKFLMPGNDPGGFIVTTLLGITGAFLAGYAGRAFGWYDANEPAGFLAAIAGAIVLLVLYRVMFRRRRLH